MLSSSIGKKEGTQPPIPPPDHSSVNFPPWPPVLLRYIGLPSLYMPNVPALFGVHLSLSLGSKNPLSKCWQGGTIKGGWELCEWRSFRSGNSGRLAAQGTCLGTHLVALGSFAPNANSPTQGHPVIMPSSHHSAAPHCPLQL